MKKSLLTSEDSLCSTTLWNHPKTSATTRRSSAESARHLMSCLTLTENPFTTSMAKLASRMESLKKRNMGKLSEVTALRGTLSKFSTASSGTQTLSLIISKLKVNMLMRMPQRISRLCSHARFMNSTTVLWKLSHTRGLNWCQTTEPHKKLTKS